MPPPPPASVSGSVIGVVRRSAGVSGSGRPEGGTHVSGVKVWGVTVGARRPTLLRQGADSGSDRPGVTHQTRKEEEEVKSSEVEQTLVSTLNEKFSFFYVSILQTGSSGEKQEVTCEFGHMM